MSQSICSTGLRWLWLVVVVLIIDLGSKYLILQNFALGDTVSLFPSLNLHYARNYGAGFSFLADSGGWQRWFFAGTVSYTHLQLSNLTSGLRLFVFGGVIMSFAMTVTI